MRNNPGDFRLWRIRKDQGPGSPIRKALLPTPVDGYMYTFLPPSPGEEIKSSAIHVARVASDNAESPLSFFIV
ncbi:hypothetical protein N7468_009376 [Penicillium chermesinum]|uniref:Uncharacterized protein n=1 Tax=Penicillium chermesinum TaxID=63820 RepID=A0A9W9TES8_9EURO|nr:uncharacterized protein N7468_009376 [Penicillium chermesinum]KAJ5220172.1 hypothetical protein N7468_009376 [Penicillium chermesinum]